MAEPSDAGHQRIVLVRHGQTEWSASGQHTGKADIPLTDVGRAQAAALGPTLGRYQFARILTSPRLRAMDTCRLALPGLAAEVDPDLEEWDYGDYEGMTSAQIREAVPGWTVWTHPSPGGESATDVAKRADAVLTRCRTIDGEVLLVAHGHLLRVLAARWLELDPSCGRLFLLDPGTLSVLGHDREVAALASWNAPPA
jgi:broad specificity phosphatase PhoE